MPKLPKVWVRLSPSCRLYEPEAGGSILLKEKARYAIIFTYCFLVLHAENARRLYLRWSEATPQF